MRKVESRGEGGREVNAGDAPRDPQGGVAVGGRDGLVLAVRGVLTSHERVLDGSSAILETVSCTGPALSHCGLDAR